jgi:magnesium-transporting ATPase (P-type)
MDLQKRKIEEFIESKLRQAKLENTSSDFSQFVMKRVSSEYKTYVEEEKRDRVAKYIIGAFSTLMVVFTFILGYLAKSDINSSVQSTGISIEPTVETSNSFILQFLGYIQTFFVNVLGLLGLTATPQTISMIVGLVLVILFYFLADRVFLKGKLKSIRS